MKTLVNFLALGLLITPIHATEISQPENQPINNVNNATTAPSTPTSASSSSFFFKPQYIALTYYLLNHPSPINAQTIHYWVDYSSKCRYKEISLKNAILTIKVYYNGNPMGRMNISTDGLQHFAFDKYKDKSSVSIEVLSIKTQQEHHARCYGYVRPKHNELLITCDPLKQG